MKFEEFSVEARNNFLRHIDDQSKPGHMIWTGRVDGGGARYRGMLYSECRNRWGIRLTQSAARIAWWVQHGRFPVGNIKSQCSVPCCINPGCSVPVAQPRIKVEGVRATSKRLVQEHRREKTLEQTKNLVEADEAIFNRELLRLYGLDREGLETALTLMRLTTSNLIAVREAARARTGCE